MDVRGYLYEPECSEESLECTEEEVIGLSKPNVNIKYMQSNRSTSGGRKKKPLNSHAPEFRR